MLQFTTEDIVFYRVEGLTKVRGGIYDNKADNCSRIANRKARFLAKYYANTEQRASPGRPKFVISESQLSYLSDHAFKAVDMARMFDVSVATIQRGPRDFNMSIAHSLSNIDNTM